MHPLTLSFILVLTLFSTEQVTAGNSYQDALNACLLKFHQQVDQISPPQKNHEVAGTVPTVYRPVHNCAEGLRASANMVKSHIEKVVVSHQQEIKTDGIKTYTCKERQDFQAGIANALLNSQAREIAVIRASTASTSNRIGADDRVRAYKGEVSHSTLGVLKNNPSLILPTSSTERENAEQVRNSFQRCSELDMNAQPTATTRSLYLTLANLQVIYGVGHGQENNSGFERCVRQKVLQPMKQETDRLQEILNGIIKNDRGVECY